MQKKCLCNQIFNKSQFLLYITAKESLEKKNLNTNNTKSSSRIFLRSNEDTTKWSQTLPQRSNGRELWNKLLVVDFIVWFNLLENSCVKHLKREIVSTKEALSIFFFLWILLSFCRNHFFLYEEGPWAGQGWCPFSSDMHGVPVTIKTWTERLIFDYSIHKKLLFFWFLTQPVGALHHVIHEQNRLYISILAPTS